MELSKVSFLLIAILFVIPQTFQSNWHSDPFHHIETIDTRGNYILEWSMNWTSRTITFNITAKTTGWVGLGFTSKGLMSSADIVIGGVENNRPYLFDTHVPPGTRRPIKDSSQDYNLLSAYENGTHTSISLLRKFETCDEHDHPIKDDTIQLIYAFGEEDILKYHHQNRGSFPTYLLDPDFSPREIKESTRKEVATSPNDLGEFRLWTLNRRMIMPERQTTYWCSIHKGPRLLHKHHLMGFHYRWENDEEFNHVHHLVLTRCRAPKGADPIKFFEPFVKNDTGEMCYFRFNSRVDGVPYQYCRENVYIYTIGMNMFFLPNHTGLAFGEDPDEYYMLQVHYDNPNRRRGIEFSINIDMYYTPNVRENDLGVFLVSHVVPGSPSLLIPPNSLGQKIYGHCGGDCTREILPREGIKIVGLLQHTHYSGVGHKLSHFRKRKELRPVINDDNYRNLYQPMRMLRDEVKVVKGDHLMLTCTFDNSWWSGKAVVGGMATYQEMCLSYIWYYNRLEENDICRSQIGREEFSWKHLGVGNLTWREEELEFVVGEPKELRGLKVSEVAERIEWTGRRREELQRDQREWKQVNTCPRIGEVVGNVYEVGYPENFKEYKRGNKRSKCK